MIIQKWEKYRIPGIVTIMLHKLNTPGKNVYLFVPPDYEEKKDIQVIDPRDAPTRLMMEMQLKSFMRISYGFDLGHSWHTFFDLIYNFGGLNFNPATKGFKAIVPLEKDLSDGINWDEHEHEINPPQILPRR